MLNKKKKSFFEYYAHEYDILTDAKKREKKHSKEINSIIKTFHPRSVLDAGCATGLSSYLFAKQSIKTVGFDCSRPMLKIARQKYNSLAPLLTFKYGYFEKLPQSMYSKFDLVVCLANSIVGVGAMFHLQEALMKFYHVLKPGGNLIVQMLNYFSIVDEEILPIKATRNKNIIYQRFSERRGKKLYIYVNRIDLDSSPLKYEMFRHEFENFDVTEMVTGLKKAKFSKIQKYSDLFLKKTFTKTAHDLVLTARKIDY